LYAGPFSQCDNCRQKAKERYQVKKRKNICPKCNKPSQSGVICEDCNLSIKAERIASQIFFADINKYKEEIERRNNSGEIRKSKYNGTLDRHARDRVRANYNSKIRRQKVLDAYGRECKCCRETIEVFLTIDHIDNNGAEHRRDIGNGSKSLGSSAFYRWLIKNNFPEGFQTLCWNCNRAKHLLGICPHQSSVTDQFRASD
jgi:hypothetical protein